MCQREKRDVSQQKKRAEGYATIIKLIHDGSVQPQNFTDEQMKKRKVFIPTKKVKHHAPDIFDVTNITQKKKSQPKKLQNGDSCAVQHIQENVEEIVINENDTEYEHDDNEEHEEISLQSQRVDVYIKKLGKLQN